MRRKWWVAPGSAEFKVQCKFYSKWFRLCFFQEVSCRQFLNILEIFPKAPVYFRMWVSVHCLPSTKTVTMPRNCPLLTNTRDRASALSLRASWKEPKAYGQGPHLTNAQKAPAWKAFPPLKKAPAKPFISWEHSLGAVSKRKSDLAVWVIVKKHLGNS